MRACEVRRNNERQRRKWSSGESIWTISSERLRTLPNLSDFWTVPLNDPFCFEAVEAFLYVLLGTIEFIRE